MELAMKIVALAVLIGSGLAISACADSYAQNGTMPQLAQERRACASLGIDPGTAAFQSCVGNLDQTMTDVNRVGSD
jgi:hypothetical protein